MMKMKKIISACLATVMILCVMMAATACAGQPPALEDVYDRLVEVIEASHNINVVIFGAGLPVERRNSPESELTNRYYGFDDTSMEYVSSYATYRSLGQIRDDMEKVYGSAYRASIEESLFTGYAMADEKNSVLPARYTDDGNWMYQNRYVKSLVDGVRTYDYASMEIVSGNATYIEVSIRSYTVDCPGEWSVCDLAFVYENGNWYLDGPSC